MLDPRDPDLRDHAQGVVDELVDDVLNHGGVDEMFMAQMGLMVPGALDYICAAMAERLVALATCKHERATFDHMLDHDRQVYACDDCGWKHFTMVDPVTGDMLNVGVS